jgi:hypothetical protein
MNKKAKKELGEATRASVKKEMAKPRMAKSAREGEKTKRAIQQCSECPDSSYKIEGFLRRG